MQLCRALLHSRSSPLFSLQRQYALLHSPLLLGWESQPCSSKETLSREETSLCILEVPVTVISGSAGPDSPARKSKLKVIVGYFWGTQLNQAVFVICGHKPYSKLALEPTVADQ